MCALLPTAPLPALLARGKWTYPAQNRLLASFVIIHNPSSIIIHAFGAMHREAQGLFLRYFEAKVSIF